MVLEEIPESPLDCKEIKSILKGISPEYSLEGLMLSTTNWHLPRSLPTTEQQCHLPSASMEIEPYIDIAVEFQKPLREFRWSEVLCAPGNLMGQLDVFRNRFYDLNPCIFSYLEKH